MARHFLQSTRTLVGVVRNNIEVFATLAAIIAGAIVPLPSTSARSGAATHSAFSVPYEDALGRDRGRWRLRFIALDGTHLAGALELGPRSTVDFNEFRGDLDRLGPGVSVDQRIAADDRRCR